MSQVGNKDRKPPLPLPQNQDKAPLSVTAAQSVAGNVKKGMGDRAARAVQEVDVSARFTRAPTESFSNPSMGASDGTHLQSTAATFAAPDTHASLGVDRISALANYTTQGGGHATLTAGPLSGTTFAQVKVKDRDGHTDIGYAAATTRMVLVGGSTNLLEGKHSVSIGGALVVAADRNVRIIKTDLADSRARVEFQRLRTGAAQISLGASTGAIGVGARLVWSRRKEVVLRRWMPLADARKATEPKNWGVRTWNAWFGRDVIRVPDLKDPCGLNARNIAKNRVLRINDEIAMEITGTFTGGVSVSSHGVYVGLHASMEASYELAVHRLEKNLIRVSLAPKNKARVILLAADVPLLAEVHGRRLTAKATRHVFDFDVSKGTALRAYRNLLEGTVPGVIMEVKVRHLGDAKLALKNLQQEELAFGVTRVRFEQGVIHKSHSVGASVSLPQMIPGLALDALGIEKRSITQDHLVVDKTSGVATTEKRVEIERQMVHLGTNRAAAYAKIVRTATSDHPDPASFSVTFGVQYDVTKGQAIYCNQALDKVEKKIMVEKKLWRLPKKTPSTKAPWTLTVERSLSLKELHLLTGSGKKSDEMRAQEILDQIGQRGLEAVGSLHRLLGDDNQLQISVENGSVDLVEERVAHALVHHPEPFAPLEQTQSQVVRRVEDYNELTMQLRNVESDVLNSVLIDPTASTWLAKKKELSAIDKVNELVKSLVDPDALADEEMQKLSDVLGKRAFDRFRSSTTGLDGRTRPEKKLPRR